MQQAAKLPVRGPAATESLAASGGLELPGREPQPAGADASGAPDATHEPIPGEHDPPAEATTQPGIVGTTGYGTDVPPVEVDTTLDEKARERIRWESGGKRRA